MQIFRKKKSSSYQQFVMALAIERLQTQKSLHSEHDNEPPNPIIP